MLNTVADDATGDRKALLQLYLAKTAHIHMFQAKAGSSLFKG